MGLYISNQIGGNVFWGLWQITEPEEWLLTGLPSEHQREQMADLHSIRVEERRRQWLAARHLVGSLCGQVGIPVGPLEKLPNGRPFLVHQPAWDLSLAHCKEWALALLVRKRPTDECNRGMVSAAGADIELAHERLIAVAPRFLSEEERLDAGPSPDRICQYWCAKEALYKWYGRKGVWLREQFFVQFTDELSGVGHIRENGALRHSVSLRFERIVAGDDSYWFCLAY